eukprot:gene1161-biopygen21276
MPASAHAPTHDSPDVVWEAWRDALVNDLDRVSLPGDTCLLGGDLNFSPYGQQGYSADKPEGWLAEDARRLASLNLAGFGAPDAPSGLTRTSPRTGE